jgi:hypothetical protein
MNVLLTINRRCRFSIALLYSPLWLLKIVSRSTGIVKMVTGRMQVLGFAVLGRVAVGACIMGNSSVVNVAELEVFAIGLRLEMRKQLSWCLSA